MSLKKIIRAVTVDASLGFVEPMLPYLSKKYEVQLLSSPGDRLDSMCLKYKVKGYRVLMQRHISLWNDLKALVRLIIIFYRERPDMVHSMTPKAGLLCMVAAWLTRVPVRVHTFTGLVWPTSTGFSRKILMTTDWITCASATHIIPEGYGVLNDLHHITKKPMKVLGYGNVRGVDMIRFSRRSEIVVRADKLKVNGVFTFIFVGRIVSDKGINELVAAFVRLNNLYNNTRLILVGRFEENLDPLKSQTIDIIKNNPSINFVGQQYGDALPAYYAASDCFILPSYREGFPNAVLEAGSMGLPCIVTDVNGSREIIMDGENGIIVPPKDENALMESMKSVMSDKPLFQRLAANARIMIEKRFEQNFVCKCLYEFYNQIL